MAPGESLARFPPCLQGQIYAYLEDAGLQGGTLQGTPVLHSALLAGLILPQKLSRQSPSHSIQMMQAGPAGPAVK